MFNHFVQVVTAMVGALVLSSLTVAAAVGPAEAATSPAAYAQADTDRVHG